MNIVHVAPNSPYNDYWGYQDNLLPKYQKKLGHNVSIIVSNRMHENGKIVETDCFDYVLNDGVKVYRRKYKKFLNNTLTGVLTFIPVYQLLVESQPSFIFYHALVSYTIMDVIKYKKNYPNCIIVQDNHMDYNIGNKVKSTKDLVIRKWLRYLNKKSIPYVDKVYGVTPWRKQYAEDYFKIPSSKTDVLIMGADDEVMELDQKGMFRENLRNKYNLKTSDFLIVTGGKIDATKKIDILMEAVSSTNNIKLLIFGNVSRNLEQRFNQLLKKNSNIIYVGWIESKDVYKYFYSADLVFFPGQHSVLWEQACASKVPCIFEKWQGMEHVNNGGNSDFVADINVENIREKIKELLFTPAYYNMKEIAESDNTDIYLYSKIAIKSLECANES